MFAGDRTHVAFAQPASAPLTVTVDLCAKAGTVTMPDAVVVPIWGYALKPAGVDCTDASVVAGIPGPTLDVYTGYQVTVNLYNALPGTEAASLNFPGLPLAPDLVGVAPGVVPATYTFFADAPGTFMYESGTNSTVQTAMGLYGALIVRPRVSGRAYTSGDTAFDSEATLVLSEIDPAANAAPGAFNFLDYDPKYFLINGKAYPQTDEIPAGAGPRLLLRYVNAGIRNHGMQSLGLRQRTIGIDGHPLAFPGDAVSIAVPAGQTADVIVHVIVNVPSLVDVRFPLFGSPQELVNAGSFPGGMMTFIVVALPEPTPPNPCAALNPPSGNPVVAIDLWAKAGSVTMPDSTIVPIWGFSSTALGDAQLPGPTLDIGPGDSVTVILHNDLAEPVSLSFPGQSLAPDEVGAPAGGTATYSFVAEKPGSTLYEAGPTPGGAKQVAMGLYGPLIVRSGTANQAYNCPGTDYTVEATLVLGEIDPLLNASPSTFNMLDYAPRYWLINGKAFPNTDKILADQGDRVLMRFLNSGLQNHTMQTLGLRQQVIGIDGYGLRYFEDVASRDIGAGQSADVITELPLLPVGTPSGTQYAVYSGRLLLNNQSVFPGGMLTFIADNPMTVLNNCTGPLTMADALTIARYVVGVRPSVPCAQNADVNHDGKVSMTDALKAARIVVGLSQ